MAREVYQWSKTAALNNFPPVDGGWPELMNRSDVNNASRENLRAMRQWYDDPEYLRLMRDSAGAALTVSKLSANVVRIGGGTNMTAYFPVGRRVKMIGGAPDPVYAHVVSAAFSTPNTDVTLDTYTGHTEVPPGLTDILEHIASTLGKEAFLSLTVTGFYLPAAATRVALQAAIDAANAAGGGTVLAHHANYPLDATLTMKSNVALFGGSWWGTRLSLNNTVNAIAISFPSSTTRASIIGITLNANGANNATGSEGISVGDGCTEIVIDQIRVLDARRDGVRIFNSTTRNTDIHVSRFFMDAPGRHGVNVEDDITQNARIYIGPGTVSNPGAYDNDGSGVKWAGQVEIVGVQSIDLNRAAPSIQRGFWGEQKIAASSKHGRFSTLSAFVARGSGEQVRGLDIGGEHNAIGPGVVFLTGTSSRGAIVDATLGGEIADRNLFIGVHVRGAAAGLRVEGDGRRNSFKDCHLRDCTTGIDVIGDENIFQDCHIEGGTTHVQVQSGAEQNVFKGNVHRDGTTGYSILAGAVDTVVEENDFDSVTTAIADAGTSSRISGNHPFLERSYSQKTGGDEAAGTIAIAGLTGIALPGVGGNGVRKFIVRPTIEAVIITAGPANTIFFQIHVGAAGGLGDAVVFRSATFLGDTVSPAGVHWSPTIEITPAAGDKVTIEAQSTGTTIFGNTTANRKSVLEIEQVKE